MAANKAILAWLRASYNLGLKWNMFFLLLFHL
jgi:hypothetical protein